MKVYETSIPEVLASPRTSAAAASPSVQAVEARNPSASEGSRQSQQTSLVDSVTILNKLQDSKRVTRKNDKDGEDSKQANRMHNILFAYNYKGDLRIRFTDSGSKVVYQTPPVYFTKMSDLMARPELSVSTKA